MNINSTNINILQNTTGKATIELQGFNNKKSTVETIIKIYEYHPSFKLIASTIMQIQKALINNRSRVSKVSLKFRIPTIYNFALIYP